MQVHRTNQQNFESAYANLDNCWWRLATIKPIATVTREMVQEDLKIAQKPSFLIKILNALSLDEIRQPMEKLVNLDVLLTDEDASAFCMYTSRTEQLGFFENLLFFRKGAHIGENTTFTVVENPNIDQII